MSEEENSVEEALGRTCVADTSLLNNFVHSGNAYLLKQLLGKPVYLSPTILNVQETLLPNFPRVPLTSEFLRPLYISSLPEYPEYRDIAPFIQSFALDAGDLWEPVDPGLEELALATRLSSKKIRVRVREACPEITRSRIELDPGEAEAAAIAVTRRWTFLTEDQASVELLRCLYPEVPVVRTCSMLVHAIERGYLSCEQAADTFNQRIVDELGFWAFRRLEGMQERLWLQCSPARCEWRA